MLTMLMEDTRFFRIGERVFEFHEADDIFFLEKPVTKREYDRGQCSSCENVFKNVKSQGFW
jgi:hypothetical protein